MNEPTALSGLRFVETRLESVKQLPGFQKHHRIPTAATSSDKSFVDKLVAPLLDEDLQQTFSALRKAYGLKRREITVDGPYEGGGQIETPFFKYSVDVEIDPQQPSRVIITRSVGEIAEPARILAPPFQEVFVKRFSRLEWTTADELDLESIIDAVEDAESEQVAIEYDKDLTWCELQVLESAVGVIVRQHSIQIEASRETTPKTLLESLVDVQQQFIVHLNAGATTG